MGRGSQVPTPNEEREHFGKINLNFEIIQEIRPLLHLCISVHNKMIPHMWNWVRNQQI
jgi:hypothetical protein